MHPARSLPRAESRRGHSLVELLIASSVLIVAVVGGFSSHVAGRQLMRESRDTSLATAILRTNMERLLLATREDIVGGLSIYADGAAVAAIDGAELEGQTLTFEFPGQAAGGPPPEVLDVALVLTWTSSTGRNRTMRLNSSIR